MKSGIKSKLSLLWIFVVLNMAYADILSLMDASSPIRKIMNGAAMPAGGLLAGAVLMETAIIMVILARFLPFRINKWANIVVATINILAVATGGHGMYYLFFASFEISAMLVIIWMSWKWKKEESK